MVGIDHGDDGNAQLHGLLHGDLVVANVDDEERVGQRIHVLDAADRLVELLDFAREVERFLLGHALGAVVGDDLLHLLQALDRDLDRLEVGEHAAQPALVDERHPGALRLFDDRLAGLPLGSDHEDRAAVGRQLAHEARGVVELLERPLEIDDVDLVPMAEDVRCHLRIPEPGLVAEMNAGLQHLTHGY